MQGSAAGVCYLYGLDHIGSGISLQLNYDMLTQFGGGGMYDPCGYYAEYLWLGTGGTVQFDIVSNKASFLQIGLLTVLLSYLLFN